MSDLQHGPAGKAWQRCRISQSPGGLDVPDARRVEVHITFRPAAAITVGVGVLDSTGGGRLNLTLEGDKPGAGTAVTDRYGFQTRAIDAEILCGCRSRTDEHGRAQDEEGSGDL